MHIRVFAWSFLPNGEAAGKSPRIRCACGSLEFDPFFGSLMLWLLREYNGLREDKIKYSKVYELEEIAIYLPTESSNGSVKLFQVSLLVAETCIFALAYSRGASSQRERSGR
jgi:hypothetical protein